MRIPTKLAGAVATLAALGVTAAFIPGPATAAPEAAAPSAAAASDDARAAGTYGSRVVGSYADGKVRGDFTPTRFFQKKGQVYAVGVLDARLIPDEGDPQEASKTITIPVKAARTEQARGRSCDILNLVLGPLDLNLLGLRIQLNRVVLDITGETGAGNLLGNLLCAVAGLLDGTGLNLLERLRLANLLNRVLNLITRAV